MKHIPSSKNVKKLSIVTSHNSEKIQNSSRKSFVDKGPEDTNEEMELNNQAVYVKSLLSNFIENSERKDYEKTNNQPINNELNKSKIKVFNNQVQNRKMSFISQKNFILDEFVEDYKEKQRDLITNEDHNDYNIQYNNKGVIREINHNNQFQSLSQSMNQLKSTDKILHNSHAKNSLNSNHTNQYQQYINKQRRKTFQEKPQLTYSKLFQEKRQSHTNNRNYIHNDLPSRNSRNSIISKDYMKKNTFSPMNNHLSFQSNHLHLPMQMPYYLNNNKNDYNHFGHSMKNNRTKTDERPSKDIRNVIPLANTNYQAFNLLCSELKNKFINKNESPSSNTKSENDKLKFDTIKLDSCDEGSTFKAQSNNKTIHELRYRNYLKNKSVYDSLSDEESDEELSGYFFIEPNSYFKMLFDALIIGGALYSIIFTPYWLAFDIQVSGNKFSIRLLNEIFIDALFFIDLVIGFFVGYYDFEEQFISKLQLIIENYLMGWFIIDLITGFPFNSLLIIAKPILPQLIIQFKLHELLKLLRVIKLFKVCMYNSIATYLIKLCSEINVISRWARLYFSLILFFLSVYLLSCIFVFLGTLDHPNWIVNQGYEYKEQKSDVLITSFYYICTTVFTIGYGDVVSVSTYERFFNLFLLVVGIMIYSWAVTALSNYVQIVDSKTMEYQKRISTLDMIRLSHEKLPAALYDKISRFLSYKLHNEKRDKNDIIDSLPIGLRNKLIMEMYKSIIGNFIFFKSFNNTDFIIRVLLALKPIQALKNERLVKEGDYIEEIIFVKRGSLALEIPLPIQFSDEIIQSIKTKQDDTFNKLGIPRKSFVLRTQDQNILGLNDNKLNTIHLNTNTSRTKTNNFLNYNKSSLFQKKKDVVNPIQTYLKIIEIRRNEHFGDILMFLNKRSPLSVKVKSKVAELLYLKKTDAVEISMSFPTFWRSIIKKSLFNMEQIERLINKALKFFFIHNEGNMRNGPHNYYQKDIEKVDTFVNSDMLYDNSGFSEKCELQSIPSLDTSLNNINNTGIILENDELEEDSNKKDDDTSINKTNSEEDSLSQRSDLISNYSQSSQKEERESKYNDVNYKESHIEDNTNIIKEEEEYEDEEENREGYKGKDEDLNSLSHSSSSRHDTIKMVITNSNVSFSSNSSNDSTNHLPMFCIKNPNSNKNKTSSKGTTILSQDATMPFTKDEINNETYPYDNLIDLKSNSNIPSLIPKEYFINLNLNPNLISLCPQEGLFNIETNQSFINQFAEDTALFGGNNINQMESSNEVNRDNMNNFYLNSKSITFKSSQTLKEPNIKEPNQKIDLNTITQSASFSISNEKRNRNSTSNNNKYIPALNHKKEELTSTSISQLSSKKTEWNRGKSKWLTKEKDKITKCKSLKSAFESRRLSQLMMSITKHENNNSENELNKTNKSIENNEDNQHTLKRKKNEKKQSTLDVISQNIEKNMMNLSNPKYFYSKYFSQVMNKTDIKDKNKLLKEKLNLIAKIIENHHPKKPN